jgi:glutamine amidotransferase
MSVVIIDSGGANIASMVYALDRIGADATVTRDPDRIRSASHVFLPGVGAAGDVMDRLVEAGLDRLIPTLSQPVLGICVGLQILFSRSDEGPVACLGVFDQTVAPLEGAPDRPIPHMGWNRAYPVKGCPLFRGLEDGRHFYFVHSYAAPVCDITIATTDYGADFTAAASRENFFGVQFHPERSGADGARLLTNFLEIRG